MAQPTVQQAFDLALQHHQAGRLREAEQLYRQILVQQPNHVEALHFLGVIAGQAGRNDIAADLIGRAVALNPNLPEAQSNLGNALKNNGRFDEAIAACRRAIALSPHYPEAYNNLGNALSAKGQLDEAMAAYRQAIALKPSYPVAHLNLGNALKDGGRLDEAIATYRRAIVLRANFPEACRCLGNALRDKGELDAAIAAYRQALVLTPNDSGTYNNLGVALSAKGQLDEAISALGHAIALKPDMPEFHSNLIYTLHFHPGHDAQSIAEEQGRWNRQHAEPLKKFIQPHANDPNAERKLRIGYVSPDLRQHVVGQFLLPLLANHDKNQFEVFAYAQVPAPDAMTQRLRAFTNVWRSIVELSDAQAADVIRQDQIDILVDLAIHTANNRLPVFARKPAPVQVSYLAYCSSTGLESVDFRISDPYLDPPGADESFYSEQTIRLPETYWCYQPAVAPPPVGPLPGLAQGYITFGCLNNFRKVTEPTLAAWGKLMKAAPNSQLLLHAHEGSHRQRVRERLEREGIELKRVQFVGKVLTQAYFDLYQRIDIALDTFPYGGGTTTCDALWMGVPVVSLIGKTAVGRGGLSILSNVGLPELAARSQEEYVAIAAELANDLPRLGNLRSTLRQRMERSPLMDAPRFARNMEAAYRKMWRIWCRGTRQT